jgi:hypothetical protein
MKSTLREASGKTTFLWPIQFPPNAVRLLSFSLLCGFGIDHGLTAQDRRTSAVSAEFAYRGIDVVPLRRRYSLFGTMIFFAAGAFKA